MKKVFGYIFKDWKLSDCIICLISVILALTVGLLAKNVDEPIDVQKVLASIKTIHIVGAVLFVVGVVFCLKETIHGYGICLCTTAFFSYGLFVAGCFGSFLVAMFICAYLIFKLVMKCLNRELDLAKFEKWDYLFLFVGLAVCAYPTYMLMDVMMVSCVASEVLVVLAALAFFYLQFKKIKYSKFLLLCMAILTTVSIAMIIVQLRIENIGLLIGVGMMDVFMIVECIKMFIKKKEIKQD